MDLSESTKIVSSRIQEIEPEHASKIVGYLLLQDCGDLDMIRLAFSPDNVIKTVTEKVKQVLGLSSPNQQLPYKTPISDVSLQLSSFRPPSHSRAFSSSHLSISSSSAWAIPMTNNQEPNMPVGYSLQDQLQHFFNLDNHLVDSPNLVDSDFYSNGYYPSGLSNGRPSRRSQSLTDFPPKICHYFNKGFCKHGASCKYIHGSPMMSESFSQFLGLGSYENGNDEYNMFHQASLEKLEMEINELLKSRKGGPVSIASLPMLYYERYGKTLQAEGFLTESQRHGKVGYSLTKLLARLKTSIRLIDRPHGQHSVILAEEAPKYFNYATDQNEHGGIVPGSRQIYLTFPADSTFSEQDVSNYFNSYGPVQDVRIPSQQKRMFGFVTFVYPETVRKILSKGNPHFVCGARVLVKPYREKSRLTDRKQAEKLQHSLHYNPQFFDRESEFLSVARAYDSSGLIRRQFLEEHKEAIEEEKRRAMESQLLSKTHSRLLSLANSIDTLKLADEFPNSEGFNFDLDVLNDDGSSSEEKHTKFPTSFTDQESNQVNLPESPFATSVANSISMII